MSMVGDIVSQIEEFVEQRDWKKFHNPKDLAISISLEASELLELFQWKSSEEIVFSLLQLWGMILRILLLQN